MGQTKTLKESEGQEPGFNPWSGTKIPHTAWRSRRKNKMKNRETKTGSQRERERGLRQAGVTMQSMGGEAVILGGGGLRH